MAASSFGASLSPAPASPFPSTLPGRRAAAGVRARPGAATPLLVALGLVLTAVLLAPEQPLDQEAICHRHNGVAACLVW